MPDNACVCCGNTIPEGRQVCRSCEVAGQKMGLLNKPAIVTNGDRIRAMTNEQLAEFITDGNEPCKMCANDYCNSDSKCVDGVLLWLRQEAKPNG